MCNVVPARMIKATSRNTNFRDYTGNPESWWHAVPGYTTFTEGMWGENKSIVAKTDEALELADYKKVRQWRVDFILYVLIRGHLRCMAAGEDDVRGPKNRLAWVMYSTHLPAGEALDIRNQLLRASVVKDLTEAFRRRPITPAPDLERPGLY